MLKINNIFYSTKISKLMVSIIQFHPQFFLPPALNYLPAFNMEINMISDLIASF